MNKNLKRQLHEAFEPPKALRKQEFLKRLSTMNPPEIKPLSFDFFLTQAGYIRKRIWLAEALLLLLTVGYLSWNPFFSFQGDLAVLSACTPFFALLTATELSRSVSYHMAELEMTTRFSLSQLVIVRMSVLGLSNLLCLLVFFVFSLLQGQELSLSFGVFRLGLFILLPYLSVCFGSIFVLNKVRSRDTSYYCAGISFFVSLSILVLYNNPLLLEDRFILYWIVSFVVLCMGLFVQIKNYHQKSEEYTWSYV